jgi:hypothetical protein
MAHLVGILILVILGSFVAAIVLAGLAGVLVIVGAPFAAVYAWVKRDERDS